MFRTFGVSPVRAMPSRLPSFTTAAVVRSTYAISSESERKRHASPILSESESSLETSSTFLAGCQGGVHQGSSNRSHLLEVLALGRQESEYSP